MTTVKKEFLDEIQSVCEKYSVAMHYKDVTIGADGNIDLWDITILGA